MVSQLVIPATVAASVAATELYPSSAAQALACIAHLHTTHRLIVGVESCYAGSAASASSRPVLREGVRVAGILHPRQVVHAQVIGQDVFDAHGQPVLLVGEEVVALVQRSAADVDSQRGSHGRMSLVAPALLHGRQVAEGAALVGRLAHHEVAERLAILAALHILVILHRGIVYILIVAQDAHADAAQHVAQPPVAPVVLVNGAVALHEEVLRAREPHGTYPVTEMLEVNPAPSLIVAHQLRRIGKVVAIESGSERRIGVAPHRLALACPSVEYLHRLFGIGLVLGDPPHHGTLVGRRCIAVGHGVIVGIGFPHRPSSTHHLLHGCGSPAERGVRTALQLVIRCLPGVAPLLHHLSGTQQLLLRVEDARMHELCHGACRHAGDKG